ncbi:hypothetical protein E5288_WYG014121 [Bos mutus]|uniref:Uncharacterized protein n=1 Tax=Bos mutus TaxID=72004 RepID=A0A6B0RZB0_9CETA|nr:hypothetical protein [Bos mutus]
MRREPASPYSDLPGSCELSHPASAPARSVASPTRPFAPPCLGTALVTNYLPESKPSGGQNPSLLTFLASDWDTGGCRTSRIHVDSPPSGSHTSGGQKGKNRYLVIRLEELMK